MEIIRGHYECNMCHRPIKDCCDGKQAYPVDISPQKPRAIWAGHGYDAETIKRLLTEGAALDNAR